eukprot:TRINITY_DN119_c0_g3_i1.p1 TRINITY_DN119_c0_g3~~TRINITY_DN119_c0_g3_i1.p1  ORF type:complete len:905 (-),score=189.46 TRINITY_DN119_c0_g3_i1:514-3228(-)
MALAASPCFFGCLYCYVPRPSVYSAGTRKPLCYGNKRCISVSFSSSLRGSAEVENTEKKKNRYPWEFEEEEEEVTESRQTPLKDASGHQTPSEKPMAVGATSNANGNHPSLPTAPWMQAWNRGPIEETQRRIAPVVDYLVSDSASESQASSLAAKGYEERFENQQLHDEGPREREAMKRIVERLRNVGIMDKIPEISTDDGEPEPEPFPTEDGSFPKNKGEEGLDQKSSWTAPCTMNESSFPWNEKKDGVSVVKDGKPRSRFSEPTKAERSIPQPELKRLQRVGIWSKERIKLKSPGINRAFLDKVHENWVNSEVVKIKCEGAPARNMKRTHDQLERRTGGYVVWRSGGSIVLYRGVNYQPFQQKSENRRSQSMHSSKGGEKRADYMEVEDVSNSTYDTSDGGLSGQFLEEYEKKIDEILDGLGPRYTDWCGRGPMPVDADLLPTIIPGYKTPYRLLPYRVRPRLSDVEMTKLRRLARTVSPHFVLGRNRNHQGLASAMVKLWESSVIAKIAVKRGVQNTNNELMAEELKRLTGGVLLSRNKEFIVFYRGKDFLTPAVSAALSEREALAKSLEEEEERARREASAMIPLDIDENESRSIGIAGTLAESLDAKARWSRSIDSEKREKMRSEAAKIKKADMICRLERRMASAQRRIARAEKELASVEAFLCPAEPTQDKETITDEERHMFRRLGLRMKAFLLLGRRGIFGGIVENMHLHWKYRELVKIISKEKTLEEVKTTALMLESQSGGILVSVDKVSKGFAIIVYRGKNYRRPSVIKPRFLLTKREALKRSTEIQRRESLRGYIATLKFNIQRLKDDLGKYDEADTKNIEKLNDEMDLAYSSEDEEREEPADELQDVLNAHLPEATDQGEADLEKMDNCSYPTVDDRVEMGKSLAINFGTDQG